MSTLNSSFINTVLNDKDVQDNIGFLFELSSVSFSERYNEIIEYLSTLTFDKVSMIKKDTTLLYFKELFLKEIEKSLKQEIHKIKNADLTIKQITLKILNFDFISKAIKGKVMIDAIGKSISDIEDESDLDFSIKGALKMLLEKHFLNIDPPHIR